MIHIRERWLDMKQNKRKNSGMELLIQQYINKFETEENLNYYLYKDFVRAKRKYLKYVLDGTISNSADLLQ